MTFDEFQTNVTNWSHDRGIYTHSDAKVQMLKCVSEIGELADNVAKGRYIGDDVGDVLVTLINVAYLSDVCMEESMDCAWNDIKDRKGRMIEGGVFIKESDNA